MIDLNLAKLIYDTYKFIQSEEHILVEDSHADKSMALIMLETVDTSNLVSLFKLGIQALKESASLMCKRSPKSPNYRLNNY